MWKNILTNETINRPKNTVRSDGIKDTKDIFTCWSREELKNIGWYEFIEIPFNQEYYLSNGFNDTIDDYTITRTHILIEKNLTQLKNKVLNDLASTRYNYEVGGIITPTGLKIKTDRETQATLTGTMVSNNFMKAQTPSLSLFPLSWKTENGFVDLDEATFNYIALTVATHVQTAFAKEKMHIQNINNISTLSELLAYEYKSDFTIQ